MAEFFDNLSYSVVSGAAGSIVSTGVNQGLKYVNKLLGNTPGENNARFYYKYGDGGIFNILAHNVIGTAMSMTQQYAIEQLKALLYKKKDINNEVKVSQLQKLTDDHNKYDGADRTIEKKRYGIMEVNGGANYIVATDFTGRWCPDAVMLGVPADPKIVIDQVNIYQDPFSNERTSNTVDSDTIVWWDVTGLVTIQNDKKVILTPVSGRDYTRKELFGNGDVSFTITGRMNSNLPDVYPEGELMRFIQIMQYKGPVTVVSQILGTYGIEKCVITGYNLPQKEGYRNIQEYTINCVGIQPTFTSTLLKDTIYSLNDKIQENVANQQEDKWKKILDDAVEGLKGGTVNAANDVATSANNSLLNKLI